MAQALNELQQHFNTFSPLMRKMVHEAVDNAVSFVNDHVDGMSVEETLDAMNLSAVYTQSVFQLAQLIDPDYSSDDIVTPGLRKALQYVVVSQVAFKID